MKISKQFIQNPISNNFSILEVCDPTPSLPLTTLSIKVIIVVYY